MLALLLTELKAEFEFRDPERVGEQSVPESSEARCLSSKLITVRIVEFIRPRFCGVGVEEFVGRDASALPLTPLVEVRYIAALTVPSEASARVDLGEGQSCEALDSLVGVDRGVDRLSGAAGAAFVESAGIEESFQATLC
jgi:hypothetical protein